MLLCLYKYIRVTIVSGAMAGDTIRQCFISPYLREGDGRILATRRAHASAVIKTLKQLLLGSWHTRAKKKAWQRRERKRKGGREEERERERERDRERERELEAAVRNNCAIVSCHLNRMYDKLRRHPRRAKATMHYGALSRTARSRERRDHPRSMRQWNNHEIQIRAGDRRWEHRDRVIRVVSCLRL